MISGYLSPDSALGKDKGAPRKAFATPEEAVEALGTASSNDDRKAIAEILGDKGLITFASYNAGPGRVAQLRKPAAKRGPDPNKWFNHVEVIAAEKVGRETVQYVSNFHMYYLAYKMIVEQGQERQKAKEEAKKEAG